MARNILIQTPSDSDEIDGFTFTVTGYVSPADTPVTVTLYHGLTQVLNQVDAINDTTDHTKWTLGITVTDDGDYVLIATQKTHTNIIHSVSFNVARII